MRALAAMLVVCAAASCGRRTPAARDAGGDAALPSQPEVGTSAPDAVVESPAPVEPTTDGPVEVAPEAPLPLPRPIKAIALASGSDHTCALLEDHRVKCWGQNGYGQLGLGDKFPRGIAPSDMGDALPAVDLGTGRTAKALAGGKYATCALLDDASVKCWGWASVAVGTQNPTPEASMIGDVPGEMGDALAPIDLGAGHTARAIAMGAEAACAVREDESARCWGRNSPGQDVPGVTDGRHVIEAVGARGVVARYDDGSVGVIFGDNAPRPPGALPATTKALALAGNPFTACAVFAGNVVGCSNTSDPLAGWPDTFDAPVESLGLAELSLTCWSLADGRVRCRGGVNTWAVEPGQGIGDKTLRLGRAVALTSGGLYHLCALLATGEVRCWGNGESTMAAYGGSLATPSDGWPSVNLGTIRAP